MASVTLPYGAKEGAIQKAIDNVARTATPEEPGVVLLRSDEGCARKPYSIGAPINLKSNIRITATDPPKRACIERKSTPNPNTNTSFAWLRNIGVPVSNVELSHLRLRGRGPGDVPQEQQAAFVDFGVLINPAPTNGYQDPTGYAKNVRLTNVRFEQFYGVSFFSHYLDGILFDGVESINPTKGGLIFSVGSRGGTIRDTVSTLAGDDAMAFTSGGDSVSTPPEREALTTNFVLERVTLTQETNQAMTGGVLAIRGATEITVRDSDIGPGGGHGAVFIFASNDPDRSWHVETFLITGSRIRASDFQEAVWIGDPALSGVRIGDDAAAPNTLIYQEPNCGVFIRSDTPRDQVALAANTIYQPDGPNNVCESR